MRGSPWRVRVSKAMKALRMLMMCVNLSCGHLMFESIIYLSTHERLHMGLEMYGDAGMDGACKVAVDANTCSYGRLPSHDEKIAAHNGLPSGDDHFAAISMHLDSQMSTNAESFTCTAGVVDEETTIEEFLAALEGQDDLLEGTFIQSEPLHVPNPSVVVVRTEPKVDDSDVCRF
ncbi:hypothetical protein GOP47_0007935 [Adiantum capillus-veneris]|uniref:Uncharacterized protein n=1 Tax=Adiantum capillus-veneris TaxID=13818 RepID=A0A9D4V2B5_ADICA|nr:hypothetical protein GOP47_0007935 [Adiantum capillus-veneris]